MLSTITVGSNTYNLITMPSSPGFSDISFVMNDTVATVMNPFTMQLQTQTWPGADAWSGQATLPPMNREDIAPWRAFLAELRGMQNVFQLGDPTAPLPLGSASGSPVVSMTTTGTNLQMSTTLYTRGWTANAANVLLPDDYIQIGYRLYKVLDPVSANSSGDASFSIWPSIRDVMTDGQQIVLSNCTGLFRLSTNRRTWQSSPRQANTISFGFMEVR